MDDIREVLSRVWPEWEIIEELGRGTYGVVFKARRQDLSGTSYAAIKVMTIPLDETEPEALRQEGLSEAQCRTYFETSVRDITGEIRLMEKVRGYTNIVDIEDHRIYAHPDRMRWDIFIRMELLTPLNRYLADHATDEETVIRLGIDLCTALEVCRRESIAHRDIKPSNVFANAAGVFKLGDFGESRRLERHTMDLSRRGSFNYMAPEVFTGSLSEADIDAVARTDLYSLGIMLYRLTNGGRLPFVPDKQLRTPADNRLALEQRMSGKVPPPPRDASPGLAAVILKACAPVSGDRYTSAAQMRQALEVLSDKNALQDTAPASAPETSAPASPVGSNADAGSSPTAASVGAVRRRLVPLAIIAALALAAAGWFAGARFSRPRMPASSPLPAATDPAPTDGTAPPEDISSAQPADAIPRTLSARIPLSDDRDLRTNIALAASSVDGISLEHGERFSFNEAVGPRDASRGYVTALNGRGAEVVGGGVAQVASALWLNVKQLPDVTVLSRSTYPNYNQHYVDDAEDAILTDYKGRQDFSFRYDGDGTLELHVRIDGDELICDIIHAGP